MIRILHKPFAHKAGFSFAAIFLVLGIPQCVGTVRYPIGRSSCIALRNPDETAPAKSSVLPPATAAGFLAAKHCWVFQSDAGEDFGALDAVVKDIRLHNKSVIGLRNVRMEISGFDWATSEFIPIRVRCITLTGKPVTSESENPCWESP